MFIRREKTHLLHKGQRLLYVIWHINGTVHSTHAVPTTYSIYMYYGWHQLNLNMNVLYIESFRTARSIYRFMECKHDVQKLKLNATDGVILFFSIEYME